MSSIPKSDWDWRDPEGDRRRENERSDQRETEEYFRRRNATHRNASSSGSGSGSGSDPIVDLVVWLSSLVIGRPIAYLVRAGYGKHLVWFAFFLFFVAPVIATVAILAMKIHADPAVFLAGWQRLVVQHPGAASWTWVFRDFVDVCRW